MRPPLAAPLCAALLAATSLVGCGNAGRHHAAGYATSSVHGPDMKMQTEDCRDCHGDDLAGGPEVSCDECHTDGWRTNCTFCHGGDESDDGAPPRDLDGATGDAISFPVHTAHVTDGLHVAYDCEQCHRKPEDVLSEGHIFDDTDGGRSEVDFSSGIAGSTVWDGAGCSNNYCHGNGQVTGSRELADGEIECGDCHAVASGFANLSGEHRKHMNEGLKCEDCHPGVQNREMADPAVHVNGEVNLALPTEVTLSGDRCTGRCHNENHNNERW